jgi:hypothetical protein
MFSAEEAEEFARQVALEERRKVCLILSRRLSIWFDEQGSKVAVTEPALDESNHPQMRLGRHRFVVSENGSGFEVG